MTAQMAIPSIEMERNRHTQISTSECDWLVQFLEGYLHRIAFRAARTFIPADSLDLKTFLTGLIENLQCRVGVLGFNVEFDASQQVRPEPVNPHNILIGQEALNTRRFEACLRKQGFRKISEPTNHREFSILDGIGDNGQGMMGFAELFLSQGYAVLVPDSRAQGTSGGGFPTYGVEESKDVRDWFNWLQTRQHPNCVFGMGESMGAAIVLQAVKTAPFCAVVAESPFANFRQISYIRVGQIFRSGEWLGQYALRPSVELAFVYARLTRGVKLTAASPELAVTGSKVPILLIHGLADNNIPPHQSETIRDHNPADIALWEVPYAGHCGAVSIGAEEFDSRVLGWIAGHSVGTRI